MSGVADTGPVVVEEEPNGLAAMLAELIRQNLERDPARLAILDRSASYSIAARDIGLAVTLRTGGGRLFVANGTPKPPQAPAQVRVRADATTLLEFSSVPLRAGQPDVFSRQGREALGKLFARRMTVKGLLRHPGKLARLNRLLSAN